MPTNAQKVRFILDDVRKRKPELSDREAAQVVSDEHFDSLISGRTIHHWMSRSGITPLCQQRLDEVYKFFRG